MSKFLDLLEERRNLNVGIVNLKDLWRKILLLKILLMCWFILKGRLLWVIRILM